MRARTHLLWLTAAAAAVSAALIAYKSRKAEAEHPPRGRFVEVDGVRLHYIERGLGTPLVLLHGDGLFAEEFETSGLIALAARRYRVIAFDRPGFGYSERPRGRVWTPQAQARLLHRALQQLGVSNAIVLGHSWASMVALAYGALFPGETRSLVLLSGYYYPTLRLDVALAAPPAIPILGDVLRYTLTPWLGRLLWPGLLKRLFGPGPMAQTASRLPPWMALRPSQLRAAAAEAAMMIPAAVSLMPHHAALRIPVYIMAGTADLVVSTRWQSERLHRRIRGSTYRASPGAGHMLHHLAPEDVLALIDTAASELQLAHEHNPVMENARAAVQALPTGGDIYRQLSGARPASR